MRILVTAGRALPWARAGAALYALWTVSALAVAPDRPAGGEMPRAPALTENEATLLASATDEGRVAPGNRTAADRPDVTAAFSDYERQGGLLRRLRFAEAHAMTAGFTEAALAPLLGAGGGADAGMRDALRAQPLAFDLLCDVDGGGATTAFRASVDVPAGLIRFAPGRLQAAFIGEGSRFLVRVADSDLGVFGVQSFDRITHRFTGFQRAGRGASCELLPFSRLFGAAEAAHGAMGEMERKTP